MTAATHNHGLPVTSQTIGEEIFNAVTHGAGALLSFALLPVFIFLGVQGDGYTLASALVFGISLLLLYLFSTLYHALPQGKAKNVFQRLDHIAIYLLIAGTYTPFTLLVLEGTLGWGLFAAVWILGAIGITCKAIFGAKYDLISTLIYVGTGWLALFAIRSLYENLPLLGFLLLVAGGVAYTAGVPFYLLDGAKKWFHGIWHLLVLLGSSCHAAVVLLCVF